ncbi:amino acid ABC transporter permease [Denitromonas iodatirespirans]|uniref:Amino acid ABC transporter permease n=1 Tax=Denitromonas iodatirespirans TaxID=2795389 RepID=A0A944DCA0_DENI1|nr:amino acid ABC transporter permease [Denitromonas iodatirespirans]MBT0960093.1 amino acid ABC transporter permease [Denitromonas iodatirespirans]
MSHNFVPLPDQPPPTASVGAIGWLRRNLFSSIGNTLLTLLSIYVLAVSLPPVINWAFIDADWVGVSRDACTSGGACWVFVSARFETFMYGFFPAEETWRINLIYGSLFLCMAPLFFDKFPYKVQLGAFVIFVFPIFGFILMFGGVFGLTPVETSQWGGMTLTLLLASVGCVAALPLGILLALGRQATNMPAVKSMCVLFIEFWRGVPLITVLFMSSVMLPLFLPEGVSFDKLLRALIGITLFQSAYMAEVVRGGLQAIPKGQYEAADALGLSYWKKMGLIVLPQAMKIVIPGIVNTFIALFKDTTLVIIVGLLEILGMVQNALNDPNWLGYSTEGYVFTAFMFWIFCFSMSRYSQALERKLHTGHKR